MMNNCPRVLLVGLIASSLLTNGNSFPFEGSQVEEGYYDVIKEFPPGYGGDWDTKNSWGDVPYKGGESKGWGPDYGRSEDWVPKRMWEEQGNTGHGGLLPGDDVVLPVHEIKRGEWDRKELGRGDWDQKGWDRKEWDGKEWERRDSVKGDWDRKDWDHKGQWKRPPLEHLKKVPGFDMLKDSMKHGKDSLVSFLN